MDMKDQRFGIEIEMTGVTRSQAANIASVYFGSSSRYLGAGYDTYAALDSQGRQWKFVSDSSIDPQKKEGRRKVAAGRDYQTEMVSPICRYEDIQTVQELIRLLKEAGAITNKSCGIHVHIDALPFNANTLRNITNIMAAKEDLIYKALEVTVARQHRWCRPVEQRFLDEINSRKPQTMQAVKEAWADVLDAKVLGIRQGIYGLQMELSGVKPRRVAEFTAMLAGYCSVPDYEKWVTQEADEPVQTPEMKL